MTVSAGSGRAEQINAQDSRFSLWTRGFVNDQPVEALETISSIHSALSAQMQWPKILSLAYSPELSVFCSNITEIGLMLQENNRLDAPRSYPARLTALLYERAVHCDYAHDQDLVVLPCELVENNGTTLKSLVRKQDTTLAFRRCLQKASLPLNSHTPAGYVDHWYAPGEKH